MTCFRVENAQALDLDELYGFYSALVMAGLAVGCRPNGDIGLWSQGDIKRAQAIAQRQGCTLQPR